MRSAIIASYVRTPFARSWSGGLSNTHPTALGGTVISESLARAGVEGARVDDVVFGCAAPEGAAGQNVARLSALRGGLPVTTPGVTVNRLCASSMQAVAMAAQRIMTGELDIAVAGGVESISVVQNSVNMHMVEDTELRRMVPDIYMPMLQTAEVVASRYGISRDAQDALGLSSQQRAAAAHAAGRFDAELTEVLGSHVSLGADGSVRLGEGLLSTDECPRPETTADGLARLRPVLPGGSVTAGTASPFADGASAMVLADEQEAEARGLTMLARFKAFAVAGVGPEEMGIGPVPAVRRLLDREGLSVEDIDLWELNEAFASQVVYCRDTLGIPDELLNVNGGAIALGHPYGASGARLIGHAVVEGRRRGAKLAVATMCIGGGQGAAALIEIISS